MTDNTSSTSPMVTGRTAGRRIIDVAVAVIATLIAQALTGGTPAGVPTSVDVAQVVVCGTPHPQLATSALTAPITSWGWGSPRRQQRRGRGPGGRPTPHCRPCSVAARHVALDPGVHPRGGDGVGLGPSLGAGRPCDRQRDG